MPREEGEQPTMAYDIGEKPGKGIYCCSKCDWKVTLDDDDDTLPPCGKCGFIVLPLIIIGCVIAFFTLMAIVGSVGQ